MPAICQRTSRRVRNPYFKYYVEPDGAVVVVAVLVDEGDDAGMLALVDEVDDAGCRLTHVRVMM